MARLKKVNTKVNIKFDQEEDETDNLPAKKERKKKEVKYIEVKDCWWINELEDGKSNAMIFTSNYKKKVNKFKDVIEFATYQPSLLSPYYAIQYMIATSSPNFKKMLELFELDESHRVTEYEFSKRKRKVREKTDE